MVHPARSKSIATRADLLSEVITRGVVFALLDALCRNSHVFCMQEIKIENSPTWCPIENLKYRLIHGKCFYFETIKKHSYEISQRNCDGKFPNGGKLFEPQTLEFNKKVLESN